MIYYFVDLRATIYFVMAFAKNVQEDLTQADRKMLRRIAHQLDEES